MIKFLIFTFLLWQIILAFIERWAYVVIHPRPEYFGPSPWANFDGEHYLVIAEQGYHQYQQAFFPFFPMLIHFFTLFLHNYLTSAFLIVHGSFILALILLWKLVKLDFDSKVARWSIVFAMFFPTSFFFGSIYTESLFLMLVLGSFYAARKKRWFTAGLLGAIASATKFVGVLLLPALLWEWWEQSKIKGQKSKVKNLWGSLIIPIPLIGYMTYLYFSVGDPLAFIHAQVAFGAQRSGGEIILLPQVLFRYVNMIVTVSWFEYDLRIAELELFMFLFVFGLLLFSWQKMRKSYLIFSLLALLVPALTGSLSSIPRYVLVCFPIFIILATIGNMLLKYVLVFCFFILFFILGALFTRGYFVG